MKIKPIKFNFFRSNTIPQILELNTTITSLKATLASQQLALTEYQTQLSANQKDVASALHVEKGVLSCGSASGWTDGMVPHSRTGGSTGYQHSKQVTQMFARPYTTPPVVFLSDAFRY